MKKQMYFFACVLGLSLFSLGNHGKANSNEIDQAAVAVAMGCDCQFQGQLSFNAVFQREYTSTGDLDASIAAASSAEAASIALCENMCEMQRLYGN